MRLSQCREFLSTCSREADNLVSDLVVSLRFFLTLFRNEEVCVFCVHATHSRVNLDDAVKDLKALISRTVADITILTHHEHYFRGTAGISQPDSRR
jgi:hypothetical protein